jgi:hypothetical protein
MNTIGNHVPLCSACGEPVDVEAAHNPHAEDCPARQNVRAVCECYEWVHPDCIGSAEGRSEGVPTGSSDYWSANPMRDAEITYSVARPREPTSGRVERERRSGPGRDRFGRRSTA